MVFHGDVWMLINVSGRVACGNVYLVQVSLERILSLILNLANIHISVNSNIAVVRYINLTTA